MRGFRGYAVTCAVLVAASAGVLMPLLPPQTRVGLWSAGVAAWLIQAAAAGARIRWGGRPDRLLSVWGWSAGVRLSAVGLAAVAAVRVDALHLVTTLVGLAGYLFVMMLLEPVFLKIGSPAQTEPR